MIRILILGPDHGCRGGERPGQSMTGATTFPGGWQLADHRVDCLATWRRKCVPMAASRDRGRRSALFSLQDLSALAERLAAHIEGLRSDQSHVMPMIAKPPRLMMEIAADFVAIVQAGKRPTQSPIRATMASLLLLVVSVSHVYPTAAVGIWRRAWYGRICRCQVGPLAEFFWV